jgi:hypothetical protein
MAKPATARKMVRVADLKKISKTSGIRPHRVLQYFDPLPAGVKRDLEAKFEAYLERPRASRTARKAKTKTSRPKSVARKRQAAR